LPSSPAESNRPVIVVSGPGGVGKGALVARLLEDDPRLWLSRSWTTRRRRPGEAADAYVFVTRDEFLDAVHAGGFLEWVEFLDYLQGTPVPDPPGGCDAVFEIDVAGARSVAEIYDDPLLVFVDAPSREAQRARLEARGDPPDRIAARLERADQELAAARELGATIVINDDLETCARELAMLIEDHRARISSPSGPVDD
jgi:guanylate kinase